MRYSPGYGRSLITEDHVVAVVVGALLCRKVVPFVIDAGSKALVGRAVAAMRRLGGDPSTVLRGRMGAAAKGFPDVIGIQQGTGRFVAIEVKRPGENPRLEQVAWLTRAWQAGALVGVAWSARDVDTILDAEEIHE